MATILRKLPEVSAIILALIPGHALDFGRERKAAYARRKADA